MIQIQKRQTQIYDLKIKSSTDTNKDGPLGQERDRRTLAANKSCMDKEIGKE